METTAEERAIAEREIVVSRLIEGPRDLVFEMYTSPDHLARWWGPNGFTTTTYTFEFRPGGVWEFTMHDPDGTDYPNRIEWLEITRPERILLLHGEAEDDPDTFTSTITLLDQDGATLVTLRSRFQTKEQRDRVVDQYQAIEGGRQTLWRLDVYVRRQIDAAGETVR